MAIHGYRLHVVEGLPGHGHTPIAFKKKGLAKTLHASLKDLEGSTYLRDARYRVDGLEQDARLPAGTPVLKVDTVERIGLTIQVQVSYGRTGEHGFLLGHDGEVQPIEGWAPANHYKVLFFCPRDGGVAVMVSSTTGRTHAGEMLLRRASVEASAAASHVSPGSWYRWRPRVLVDDKRIDELVSKGAIEGITLSRKGYDKAGNQVAHPVKLTQQGVRPAYKNAIRTMIKRWLEAEVSGKRLSKHEEVAALTELVEGDVGGIQFTDGELAFSEIGKRQVVGPDNLGKILIYPVGDTPLDFNALRNKAGGRLKRIIQPLGIPLDL